MVQSPSARPVRRNDVTLPWGGTATTGSPDAGTPTTTASLTGVEPSSTFTVRPSVPKAFTPSKSARIPWTSVFQLWAVMGWPGETLASVGLASGIGQLRSKVFGLRSGGAGEEDRGRLERAV